MMMMMMMLLSQELHQQPQQEESVRGTVSSAGMVTDHNRADVKRSPDDGHEASALTSHDTAAGNEYQAASVIDTEYVVAEPCRICSLFLQRCMKCRRGLAMRILSVCLSVRQTREL